MVIAALSLLVGSDIDFCVRDDAWVPARVESCSRGILRVRLAIGGAEVVRDVCAAEAALRVAPAGAYTLPLLNGQGVDVLIRVGGHNNGSSAGAGAGAGADADGNVEGGISVEEEQWQRGEWDLRSLER